MDEHALERARQRIAEARQGRFETTRFEAALERARHELEALATTAAELEASLPDRVGAAVQEGLRREVLPVGGNLAEIRGLLNQALRRLERLEQEVIAERNARRRSRLLVDLSSGWQGVDDRLQRLEQHAGGATSSARAATRCASTPPRSRNLRHDGVHAPALVTTRRSSRSAASS
jgi:hypothetical protein